MFVCVSFSPSHCYKNRSAKYSKSTSVNLGRHMQRKYLELRSSRLNNFQGESWKLWIPYSRVLARYAQLIHACIKTGYSVCLLEQRHDCKERVKIPFLSGIFIRRSRTPGPTIPGHHGNFRVNRCTPSGALATHRGNILRIKIACSKSSLRSAPLILPKYVPEMRHRFSGKSLIWHYVVYRLTLGIKGPGWCFSDFVKAETR